MILPPGYTLHRNAGDLLLARTGLKERLLEAGLGSCRGWTERTGRPSTGAGRGEVARLALPGGRAVVLKQMRRGGLLAPLWRDRFPGRSRLLANLAVPEIALEKGIPTPEPVAMLLRQGPPGFHRAWLAVTELPGAIDLLTSFKRDPDPTAELMEQVTATVRRAHDAGLVHPDLNLGNVMIREDQNGRPPGVWLIDLDRAFFLGRPLGLAARLSALRRLERSYKKEVAGSGSTCRSWYGLYAGDDRPMADYFESRMKTGRLLLALHRIGWRK